MYRNRKSILAIGAIAALLVGIISVLIPRMYRVDSRALIIVRDRPSVATASSKTVKEISGQLVRAVYTDDFYTKVIEASNLPFNRDRWLNLSSFDARAKWHRAVRVHRNDDSGFLSFTVYSNSKDDALNLAAAVNQTFIGHAWEYIGSDVNIKIVDAPVLMPWGTRPNVLLNIVVAFVVGVLIAVVWYGWGREKFGIVKMILK